MQLKKLLTIITKILFSVFVITYPFMIFYALQQNIAVKFIGIILLMVVIFSFLHNKNKSIFLIGLTLCLFVVFFNQEIFLKLYPVLMNATVGTIFAWSLHKTPLITKFAQKMQKTPLDKNKLIYTRCATIAWTIFMFINTVVSLITVFLSNEIWTLYNGFISYVLIGIMMLSEYIVRQRFKKCSVR